MKNTFNTLLLGLLSLITTSLSAPNADAAETAQSASKIPLVWDAMEKTIVPAMGDTKVEFTFWVTNTSSASDIIINQLNPACDCTTPSTKVPWKLAPGASGSMKAAVDIKGNSGNLVKTIAVVSTAGNQTLTMKINIPKGSIASAKPEATGEKALR